MLFVLTAIYNWLDLAGSHWVIIEEQWCLARSKHYQLLVSTAVCNKLDCLRVCRAAVCMQCLSLSKQLAFACSLLGTHVRSIAGLYHFEVRAGTHVALMNARTAYVDC